MQGHEPLSVSDFVEVLNNSLRQLTCSVVGEISELTVSARGHVYFTIKDNEKDASLPCTMWASKYAYSGVKLEKGMEVQVTGKPEFYAPFGKLSFISNQLELVGEGALKKAYDKLKLQLEKEGVFSNEKKRPIPDFVKTIGVVTSSKGAVIHDFSNNLGKNGFEVKIMHTNVEGRVLEKIF
jgi:exodeoxyribonuclease VII large subunit